MASPDRRNLKKQAQAAVQSIDLSGEMPDASQECFNARMMCTVTGRRVLPVPPPGEDAL